MVMFRCATLRNQAQSRPVCVRWMYRLMPTCFPDADAHYTQFSPYYALQTKKILLPFCPVSCTKDVSGELTSRRWVSSSQRQAQSVGSYSAGLTWNRPTIQITIWCVISLVDLGRSLLFT